MTGANRRAAAGRLIAQFSPGPDQCGGIQRPSGLYRWPAVHHSSSRQPRHCRAESIMKRHYISEGWMKRTVAYRRAVTRRASKTLVPEPAFRKQDVAKSGQTCVEQFGTTARTSSRSPLASTATSSACTFEARPGKARTEAPRSINIARAECDLTILGC